MTTDRSNQRRFHRVSAAFRVEGVDTASRGARFHALKDVSLSGLRISSGEAVAPSEAVEVRFPDIDPEFVARGSVVWCERRGDTGFEIGLRLDKTAPDFESVCTRIQEIEKYRKTVEDLRGQPMSPEEAARQWFSRFGSTV